MLITQVSAAAVVVDRIVIFGKLLDGLCCGLSPASYVVLRNGTPLAPLTCIEDWRGPVLSAGDKERLKIPIRGRLIRLYKIEPGDIVTRFSMTDGSLETTFFVRKITPAIDEFGNVRPVIEAVVFEEIRDSTGDLLMHHGYYQPLKNEMQLKEFSGRVPCSLRKGITTIAHLAQQIEREATGNSCIPETYEYDYACRIVEAARRLNEREGVALMFYTGIQESELGLYAAEASAAVKDAYQALYGD